MRKKGKENSMKLRELPNLLHIGPTAKIQIEVGGNIIYTGFLFPDEKYSNKDYFDNQYFDYEIAKIDAYGSYRAFESFDYHIDIELKSKNK